MTIRIILTICTKCLDLCTDNHLRLAFNTLKYARVYISAYFLYSVKFCYCRAIAYMFAFLLDHICCIISVTLSRILQEVGTVWIIYILTRGVPDSGFRLFGRIWIVLWTIRLNTNTNSVAGWAFWRCTCCSDIYYLLMSLANYGRVFMLSSHDPIPSFVPHNQVVWATASGTDRVKSAV